MDEKAFSQAELTRAALNLPADEFMLGGRVFKIMDLEYDDYTLFMSQIVPLIEKIGKKIILSKSGNVELPGGITLDAAAFSAFDLMAICGSNLPQMAQIVCKNTDPDITVEEVKKLAKKPTVLAEVVLKQIIQNRFISDFAQFFKSLISMGMGDR